MRLKLYANLCIAFLLFTYPSFSQVYQHKADFETRSFKGFTKFAEIEFQDSAVFEMAHFDDVSFHLATIRSFCDFSETSFKNVLDLSNLRTGDQTRFDFLAASLPNMIDLSGNPALKNQIDLTLADVADEHRDSKDGKNFHYINLFNTDVSKIKIDYQYFRLCFFPNDASYSGLYFGLDDSAKATDTLYFKKDGQLKSVLVKKDTAMYRQFLKIDAVKEYLKQIFPSANLSEPVVIHFLTTAIMNRDFIPPLSMDEEISTYENVLKNFETNGQKESYEALDIEYRDYKNGWFILPHIWNCYGYRREWVFYWALAFLAFFTITTTFFISTLNKPTAEGGVYHMDNLNIDPATERWYNRLWYAFMYTSTLFFILKVDVSKLNFKKKAGVFYIITIYSVGLLCLAYMANFVLQK